MIVFMHGKGAAMNNVYFWMTRTAKNLQADVVCFAYRGFTQSEGSPSDAGVQKDAEAMIQFTKSVKEDY